MAVVFLRQYSGLDRFGSHAHQKTSFCQKNCLLFPTDLVGTLVSVVLSQNNRENRAT